MSNIEFDIDKVADLSMLSLSDEERTQLEEQLPSIVAYVSKLHEVDTSNVSPKAYLTQEKNVFRDDVVVRDDQEIEQVIANFPKKTGKALEVPGVFE
ncbi:MAG: Asp-tRNA(Asn)/Glu-tRNA(Gln) amidotransferase subunit GatC [Patescibacteria group bacterium]|nr:Asp-tRNA(Asn)/Glu-tRNA(Gln) amidotransferase subunit GatC [Patescibacteria group bacterium]